MSSKGEFIKGQFAKEFMLSLENKDVVSIPAGEYIVLIDPIWDETAKNDKAYFEINADVFGPQNVALTEIEKDHGRELLK